MSVVYSKIANQECKCEYYIFCEPKPNSFSCLEEVRRKSHYLIISFFHRLDTMKYEQNGKTLSRSKRRSLTMRTQTRQQEIQRTEAHAAEMRRQAVEERIEIIKQRLREEIAKTQQEIQKKQQLLENMKKELDEQAERVAQAAKSLNALEEAEQEESAQAVVSA